MHTSPNKTDPVVHFFTFGNNTRDFPLVWAVAPLSRAAAGPAPPPPWSPGAPHQSSSKKKKGSGEATGATVVCHRNNKRHISRASSTNKQSKESPATLVGRPHADSNTFMQKKPNNEKKATAK